MSVISTPDIQKVISKMEIPAGTMEKIAMNMRSRMIKRVQKKHKDVNGNLFDEYSERTLKQKTKIGRSSDVNLTDRGKMLGGIQIKSRTNNAELWLAVRKDVGYYQQNGTKHLPEREWFGYTKDSESKARKEFEKYIEGTYK